jgi:hypothetical protein
MAESKTLDRRQFTLAAALAALSGVAITISSACGSSSSSPTGATGGGSDKVGVISNNHGRSAVITGAQLTAGGALHLDIQGTATHPHSVDLSAAEIGMIAGNQQVTKVSTNNNGHTHNVTFN